ncbi:uncharacterized protein LOC110387553 [Numida meleagris]|uniref:uncharacterized protein LOC110387553 n=1 Tax=Numida meleagris TaxID=8996 RepID=UPI000B3D99B9|nr:uncharacterized protein LOC110387553 [Numida meleagris]
MGTASSSPQGRHCRTLGCCRTRSLFPWAQSKAQGCPLSLGSQLLPGAGTGTGSRAECNSWQSGQRAASVAALIPIHAALPVFTRGRLFVLALKPGLFPLPVLCCCLLFLPSAFHSGFNSPRTLPNGFFTWGPQHAQRQRTLSFQKFHAPLEHKKGLLFPHFPTPPHPGHAHVPLYTADTKAGGWATALRAGPVLTPGRVRLCQHRAVPGAPQLPPPALAPGPASVPSSPPSALGGRGDGQPRSAPPSSGCGTRPLPAPRAAQPSFTPSAPLSHPHPPPSFPHSLQPHCQAVGEGGKSRLGGVGLAVLLVPSSHPAVWVWFSPMSWEEEGGDGV